nr:siphovirus Gp157 family protein [Acetobacter senegalensis]
MRPALLKYNECIKGIQQEGANTDAYALEEIGILAEIERQAKHCQELLRPKLALRMQEDGVTGFHSENWQATLRQPAPDVRVTDEKALKSARPELWEPQPDKLNRTELKKLAKKEEIPGVVLGNGGAPVLVVSARKDV